MSTLLEQASLIMIPSGYKEDVVYSVIPENGNGDLAFTRASDGTRINSAGLVEVVPWNLCTYSEQFQLVDWLGGGNGKPTMTDNFAEAPNGTMTASQMEVAGSGYQLRQNTAIENTQMTISFWLRTNTGTKTIKLILNDGVTAYLNITVTTTWTRYEVSGLVTTLSGSGRCGLQTLEALTSGAYILVWGAQLNIGSTANPYFPTTDRLNVPRLTYQNGGGGCPSLLLEKQSTNYFTYSEELQTGTGGTITVTPNTAISPDGTQNADSLGAGYLTKSLSATAGTWTFSTFAKYLTTPSFVLYIYDGSYYQGSFNLSTGVATSSTGSPTVSMVDCGNGWYRCIVTATTASTVSEVGFGSGNVYAWGCQFE